jgi:hypothetical protein
MHTKGGLDGPIGLAGAKLRPFKVCDYSENNCTSGGTFRFRGRVPQLLSDFVASPLSSSTPGVEVQAQIVQQLLSGQTLSRPDWAPRAEWMATAVICVALVAMTWILAPHSRPRRVGRGGGARPRTGRRARGCQRRLGRTRARQPTAIRLCARRGAARLAVSAHGCDRPSWRGRHDRCRAESRQALRRHPLHHRPVRMGAAPLPREVSPRRRCRTVT